MIKQNKTKHLKLNNLITFLFYKPQQQTLELQYYKNITKLKCANSQKNSFSQYKNQTDDKKHNKTHKAMIKVYSTRRKRFNVISSETVTRLPLLAWRRIASTGNVIRCSEDCGAIHPGNAMRIQTNSCKNLSVGPFRLVLYLTSVGLFLLSSPLHPEADI